MLLYFQCSNLAGVNWQVSGGNVVRLAYFGTYRMALRAPANSSQNRDVGHPVDGNGAIEMDKISSLRRSENMRRIKGKNTAPELAVRRILSEAHVRYRLHRQDLPGKPELAIGRLHMAVFVHGCFWHRHQGCSRAFTPSSRSEFWGEKLNGNVRRDRKNLEKLNDLGWNTQVIWECETKSELDLKHRLASTIRAYRESAK
jgi:DNA mismatch endonuclease (patch repair protein)